jgi:cytochrome c oxidase subunit 4
MSEPAHDARDHHTARPGAHAGHASVRSYINVAVVLSIVTALEVGVVYIRFLSPIIVPLLLNMSLAKFALVVMYYMHLRYDPRPLTGLFVGPLLIALGLSVALMTLPGAFLVFGR